PLDDLSRELLREDARRAVTPHAARVRTDVAVADPLVGLARRERKDPLAVREGHEGNLFARQELLDHDPVAGHAEAALAEDRLERRFELRFVHRHEDALARGQAVRLDYHRQPELFLRRAGLLRVVRESEPG